jgi:hypothetical protein
MNALPARALAAILLLSAGLASAQDRPSEADIFGQESEAPKQTAPARVPAAQRPAESDVLSGASGETPSLKKDPLQIGGLLYLRALTEWQDGVPPADWPLSAPALVDGYLDARPNDRVRGFLLARLQYDLARARSDAPTPTQVADLGSAGTAFLQTQNPRMLLDQLWIRFDVGRTAFVTAGKQHVKWGVGRFWNPTDFLHPVPKDPLALFDARTGLTMVKVHVPWEKQGWNLYGVGFFDETQAAGTLGSLGGGARAEVVLGTAELGLDAVVQKGRDARFGLDLSAGIWDLDVHAEVALRRGSDVPLWRPRASPDPSLGILGEYEAWQPTGLAPQAVGGVTWSWKYSDEDSLTLGAEYFFNRNGYEDPRVYPVLLYQQLAGGGAYFTPFYLGRHYAGLFLHLPRPGSWNDTTFILSTIGNLSDRSFLTRLDYTVLLLTYLQLEAYAAVRYGQLGGELRMGFDVQGIHVPAPVLDLGVALRVSL